jgi:aspartate 1-decarboxylase
VQVGDKIIVVAYATYDQKELDNYEPAVVFVDDGNNIVDLKQAL